MSKGLEELKRLAYENACCRCQYYIDNKCTNKGECVWKTIENELQEHEQYKAIEEELGISLETVGKILLNGIYVKTYLENGAVNIIFNSGKFNQIDKDEKCLLSFVSPHPIHLYFVDYGKTWALTKEELL